MIQSIRLKCKGISCDKHYFFKIILQFFCVQPTVSPRLVSIFRLLFKLAATCLHLRYSVSQTKFNLWQVITHKDYFMKVKITIASNSEMRINTQFKNHFNQLYQNRYINRRLMLLPVDRNNDGLLFIEWLHMMNKIIGYSYARTVMNSVQLCATHQAYISI